MTELQEILGFWSNEPSAALSAYVLMREMRRRRDGEEHDYFAAAGLLV